jgi:hypothetical protein
MLAGANLNFHHPLQQRENVLLAAITWFSFLILLQHGRTSSNAKCFAKVH